ncbi:MAG: hypothetical protein ACRYG5_15550 [Janthinobacterium lividum]
MTTTPSNHPTKALDADRLNGLSIPDPNQPIRSSESTDGMVSETNLPTDPNYRRPVPAGADPQAFVRQSRLANGQTASADGAPATSADGKPDSAERSDEPPAVP